ncbi:hypothetical protein ACKKBF_B37630 [Auxenochlorella protothecoides x Auxenochlorella symbiontica]
MSTQKRSLGTQGLAVSPLGFGCMGMSWGYHNSGPPAGTEEDYINVIHKAIESGCMLDTSDIYGPFTNEELVGKAIATIPREKVTLATKFALYYKEDGSMAVDGSRKHVREACEASLKRLGVDYIDLYYMHRKDPGVPIEDTMAELKLLVDEGKIKYIGVSETSPEDIRRAHAVHPLSAVQLEWSLWTRESEEDIIPLCRELGIGIVAYSPLGRGFLTGQLKPEDLDSKDSRKSFPRFQEAAFEQNMKLVEAVKKLANSKDATAGQLALAWVLAQGDDVVPIPGTKRVKYLEENLGALDVTLTAEDLAELARIADPSNVTGARYNEAAMKMAYSRK